MNKGNFGLQNQAKNSKIKELEDKIKLIKLTEEAKLIAENELNRLKSMENKMAEYDNILNYLEILLSLPWDTRSTDPVNLSKCKVMCLFNFRKYSIRIIMA